MVGQADWLVAQSDWRQLESAGRGKANGSRECAPDDNRCVPTIFNRKAGTAPARLCPPYELLAIVAPHYAAAKPIRFSKKTLVAMDCGAIRA